MSDGTRKKLRRELEELRAAETDSAEAEDHPSKLIRLPRRPRRMTEEIDEQPRKTWRSEGVSAYDPAPTRPVLRSELQATGWWPVDPGQTQHPAPEEAPSEAAQDASVFDLDALRRRRAGDDAPTTGIRRIAKPRRIASGASEESGAAGDRPGGPDSSRPDGPAQRH